LGLTSLRVGVNARNPFVVLAKETKDILIQKHQQLVQTAMQQVIQILVNILQLELLVEASI
jgi:hypothetical protein